MFWVSLAAYELKKMNLILRALKLMSLGYLIYVKMANDRMVKIPVL